MSEDGYCVVLTTVADADEADRLADGLVREGLAACVQAMPVRSTYVWKGKVERAGEILLLAKTRRLRYREVESYIVAHHGYEVPEVICLPIELGLSAYLAWVHDATD